MEFSQGNDKATPPYEPPASPFYPPPNEVFLILIISIAAALLGGTVLVKFERTALFLTELLFLIPPVIYLRWKRYPLKKCLRWNRVNGSILIAAVFIGLSLVVLLDELDRVINLFFPMPEELRSVLFDFLKLKTWFDYFIVGSGVILVASFAEESLFRGFLLVSLEAHGGVTRAVLFSALLFALAHFNPWWMVQILILGVFLGFIAWRSNSAFPGMIIHGLNNGLALFLGGEVNQEKFAWYSLGDHVSPFVLIAAAALLFLGLKLFARFTEDFFAESRADEAPAN